MELTAQDKALIAYALIRLQFEMLEGVDTGLKISATRVGDLADKMMKEGE
jgi:hypothetical protein